MAVAIDTDLVSEEERMDYWCSEIARSFFLHRVGVQVPEQMPFRRRMLGHSLGPVQVFRVTGTPSRMARTQEMIAAFDPECLSLMVQISGSCWQRQGDRVSRLSPGDAVIHDSSHPFVVQNDDPFEVLVFAFPKVLLRPHADRVCARTAVRITGDCGAGSVAVPFLRKVGDALRAGVIPEEDVNIGESVLDLVKAVCLDPPATVPARKARRNSADIMRGIQTSIESCLGDPELSPEMIARVNYVSTSYLHKLFQQHEGMSMGAWVRVVRLQRCYRDLTDPAQTRRAITDIAADWGFQSASHFSRAFRDEFGCSPRELRRKTIGGSLPAAFSGSLITPGVAATR